MTPSLGWRGRVGAAALARAGSPSQNRASCSEQPAPAQAIADCGSANVSHEPNQRLDRLGSRLALGSCRNTSPTLESDSLIQDSPFHVVEIMGVYTQQVLYKEQ
jgi:hypothetical protein